MNLSKVFCLGAAASVMAIGSLCANPIAKAPDSDQAISSIAYPAAHDAPIVSGRSIGMRHKTKMHHVRLKPDELFSDESASQNN